MSEWNNKTPYDARPKEKPVSSLDEKLKQAIFKPGQSNVWDDVAEEVIASVKQAFIDEGWVDTNKWTEGTYTGPDFMIPALRYSSDELKQFSEELNKVRLTGPEWLARFEKEYQAQIDEHDSSTGGELSHQSWHVKESARRASGGR